MFFENLCDPSSWVQNPGGVTGFWTLTKVNDKENLDWEGTILMVCRLTKRGDELREVVLPKSFSDLMYESLYY